MWQSHSWPRLVSLIGMILAVSVFLYFHDPSLFTPDIVALLLVALALLATFTWWLFRSQVDTTQLSPRAQNFLLILTILILIFPLALAALVSFGLAPKKP